MASDTRFRRDHPERPSHFTNGHKNKNMSNGDISNCTPHLLSDGKTVVYVNSNHDEKKVVENYENHQSRYCGSARKGGRGSSRYDQVDFSSGTTP